MPDAYPRDLVGHAGSPPDPRRPGGARVALNFAINHEEGGERSILHGDATAESRLTDLAPAPPLDHHPPTRNDRMRERCDLLITGGTVLDGTGAAGFAADLAVQDDRILAAGPGLGRRFWAGRSVDATGRVVAPGFIDVHTHDGRALLSPPQMPFKVSQGVTTLVAGNCGVSMAPLVIEGQPPPPLHLLGPDAGWFRFARFGDYARQLRATPPALNCGLLVGHITLRHGVMDRFDRAADARETSAMAGAVDDAMAEGAIGFSTSLDYPDSVRSSEAEVTALAARVKPFGGLCCCHHRDYLAGLDGALEEVFRIGRCRPTTHCATWTAWC